MEKTNKQTNNTSDFGATETWMQIIEHWGELLKLPVPHFSLLEIRANNAYCEIFSRDFNETK